MARSLFVHWLPILVGLTGAIGCGGGGSGGTTSGGTSSTSGSGDTTSAGGTTTAASTSSAASTAASTSSAASTASAGGAGGMGGMGAGGMGAGGKGGAGGMGSSMGGMGGFGGDPNDVDNDKDGWSVNQGDCCDTVGDCANPELVNPGAFEYLGNGVDDDCDPSTPDNVVPPECSPQPLVPPTSSDDLIKAMDLCQFTIESPPLPKKKWGVIQTALLLADGSSAPPPKDLQIGVLSDYGPNVAPRKGTTMAALSSGTARTPANPGYVHPQNGTLAGQVGNFNAQTQVGVPASWLAAHNGIVPSPGNCPTCNGANCAQAFDSVDLKARIRVPTNAKSFSYSLKFYTAEYPEFVCQQFNDFFITLLNSQWVPDPNANPPQSPLPADKNIAFDAQKNAVSVNNGFFEVCFPAVNAPAGACPGGTLELVGNGMGGWGNNLKDGGGTEWLINDSPVVPGETMEIQFIIWDAGDHNVDSLVLLDKFRWNVTPSAVGVHK